MKKKSKAKIKKILLLLSILPYLIFLVIGTFNLFHDSIENGYLDLYALIEPLGHIWFEMIANLNIVFIILIIFCVGYPIYYLLDRPSKRWDNALESNVESKKNNILFVLYMLSFLPYLFLVYSCVFGFEFGFFFNTSIYYGFQAIAFALLIGSLIPVYPTVLIFQIIFTIKKCKNFSNIQKKILKITTATLLLLLIVPSIIYLVNSKNVLNTTYNQDKVIIENYLKDEFGEEYYNMRIIKPDSISLNYRIETPLLKHSFDLGLNETRTEVISNSFYNNFVEENDLNAKLNNYLNQYYLFPEYLMVNSSIQNFDINDSNNIANLLKNCNYKINDFYILKEYYNREEIIEIIKDYYIKYDKNLNPYYNNSYLMFYVKVSNQFYASIETIKSGNDDESIHLIFSGYNSGNGYTIQHEELTINVKADYN